MLTLVFALLGCAPSDIGVGTTFPGCRDYDFDNPDPQTIEVVQEGADVHMVHTNVVASCSATFAPTYVIDGRTVEVTELWEDNDAEDACQTCFDPTVNLVDPPKGKYSVEWYVGETDVPFQTVDFKVE